MEILSMLPVSPRITTVGELPLTYAFSEGTNGRALTAGMSVSGGSANMSVKNCVSACQAANYNLAGVEYSQECCKFSEDA